MITGTVRGSAEPQNDQPTGEDCSLVLNPRGDLSAAFALPELADIVRLRQSAFVIAAAAVAPIVAMPTTTAQFTLWNGELDGGKTYVIDSIGFIVVASAAAATPVGMVVCMGTRRKTAPAADLSPRGLTGQRYRGTGYVDLAATVTNDTWHLAGTSNQGPTSQVGMTLDINLYGKYVLPPGHYFSQAVMANTVTTITVRQFVRWHEIQIPVTP